MTTSNVLKIETEKFTGLGTVKNASATTFIMVEMENNSLAKEVYNVWLKMKNTIVEISENKVYGFPK